MNVYNFFSKYNLYSRFCKVKWKKIVKENEKMWKNKSLKRNGSKQINYRKVKVSNKIKSVWLKQRKLQEKKTKIKNEIFNKNDWNEIIEKNIVPNTWLYIQVKWL